MSQSRRCFINFHLTLFHFLNHFHNAVIVRCKCKFLYFNPNTSQWRMTFLQLHPNVHTWGLTLTIQTLLISPEWSLSSTWHLSAYYLLLLVRIQENILIEPKCCPRQHIPEINATARLQRIFNFINLTICMMCVQTATSAGHFVYLLKSLIE